MPIDLSGLGESLGRGLDQIPPVAIALGLLAGPTLALVGYRLIGVARRSQVGPLEVEPFWVCHDCRSVNDLHAPRCYHCGLGRDSTAQIEVIVEAPTGTNPTTFDVPAGSPFAALGKNAPLAAGTGPGVPVMADATDWSTGVPVGPGHGDHPVAIPVVAEDGEALLLAGIPDAEDSQTSPLSTAAERSS